MPRRVSEQPIIRRQKDGRAYVTLNSRKTYLGAPFGTDEADRAYARLLSAWRANDRQPMTREQIAQAIQPEKRPAPRDETTVRDVAEAYAETSRVSHSPAHHLTVRAAMDGLIERYGDRPAREFGAAQLRALRQWTIAEGHRREPREGRGKRRAKPLTRDGVNRRTGMVVAAFKQAETEDRITEDQLRKLRRVPALRRGEGGVETTEIDAVPIEAVRKTLPYLKPVYRAMVRLQLASGARPGEIAGMSWREIDRSAQPWIYSPASHKCAHHGIERTIALGPEAQEILSEYANRPADGPIFDFTGSLRPVESYRRAIKRAAKCAGVPAWSPNQLRHTAATFAARGPLGPEGAKALLGHTTYRLLPRYVDRADRAMLGRAAESVSALAAV